MANNELTFGENDFIVSKTNLEGKITYCNSLFIQMSGFSELELMNQPHSISRHPDMPAVIFKLLWSQIRLGKEIFAYVKNKTKEGDFYWVFAHVTPSFDTNRQISGYHSVRRKPSLKALEIIKPLYASLLQKEKIGGMNSSEAMLNQLLQDKGVSYDEFILSF
jgi:PAS domain S-box-containing protein